MNAPSRTPELDELRTAFGATLMGFDEIAQRVEDSCDRLLAVSRDALEAYKAALGLRQLVTDRRTYTVTELAACSAPAAAAQEQITAFLKAEVGKIAEAAERGGLTHDQVRKFITQPLASAIYGIDRGEHRR